MGIIPKVEVSPERPLRDTTNCLGERERKTDHYRFDSEIFHMNNGNNNNNNNCKLNTKLFLKNTNFKKSI